ncbi:MAG TPA: acetyl-CoA carboxylase biotin carboxyl carrier protein [Spirochaetia bacterium]|nr:acetyl-CoA carboxylase biotin carboxyl carrier protein [Spirochaetia bacterium]
MELKELYALMERFEKSGLSEIVYKKDGEEVTLKKGSTFVMPPAQAMPMPAMSVPGAHPAPAAVAASDAPPRHAEDTEFVRAPLVGTFYRAPAPDAPPFVEKGDTVKKGKPLCILEAMKLMNEFQAEFDLEVVAILVDNGKMVEFGTPLFEVRRV